MLARGCLLYIGAAIHAKADAYGCTCFHGCFDFDSCCGHICCCFIASFFNLFIPNTCVFLCFIVMIGFSTVKYME